MYFMHICQKSLLRSSREKCEKSQQENTFSCRSFAHFHPPQNVASAFDSLYIYKKLHILKIFYNFFSKSIKFLKFLPK